MTGDLDNVGLLQGAAGRWHRDTFGEHAPEDHARAILAKLREEVGELSAEPSPEEAADVLICLLCLCDRMGWDLGASSLGKLALLRLRKDQVARDRERGIPVVGDCHIIEVTPREFRDILNCSAYVAPPSGCLIPPADVSQVRLAIRHVLGNEEAYALPDSGYVQLLVVSDRREPKG